MKFFGLHTPKKVVEAELSWEGMGIVGEGGDLKGEQDWKLTKIQCAGDGGNMLPPSFRVCAVQQRAPDVRMKQAD